jgi:hypothetical protein
MLACYVPLCGLAALHSTTHSRKERGGCPVTIHHSPLSRLRGLRLGLTFSSTSTGRGADGAISLRRAGMCGLLGLPSYSLPSRPTASVSAAARLRPGWLGVIVCGSIACVSGSMHEALGDVAWHTKHMLHTDPSHSTPLPRRHSLLRGPAECGAGRSQWGPVVAVLGGPYLAAGLVPGLVEG